ncbi:GNAT family N-acetyltransferase [Jatrophihabitans cynanchi]|uniref:GNAT family N-acetyltransferase n=1 Tax=Jatrophihabitans cynanchi TaxID=2944128 RepID=A0ABY7K1U3_9ACTN|nr:GNAT family N-acetyltransferase [Jatrophihabitans sp. SB3-54]WAX57542.1 GNAT family N-acetyltransferase [Jatrophihabitans sp. SB3-54]
MRRDGVRVLSIRHARAADSAMCRAIAAGLPEYFIADDLDEIERAAETGNCWIADLQERPTAFTIVDRRAVTVAEVAWMATDEKFRGQGIGTALLAHVLAELSGTGVQLLEVKTLDASAGYEPYESTHAFWRRHGFVQIDTIDPLPGWRPGNPAAIYIAALAPTR